MSGHCLSRQKRKKPTKSQQKMRGAFQKWLIGIGTLEVLPAYVRSKVVVNARAIVEMGNHQVYRSAPGFADHVVHPTVGLLFHYRDKCINCKMVLIVDYTARRFGSLLFDRVDNTCLEVFLNRGICDLV